MKEGYYGKEIAALFESEGVYPELATETHVLFIHGLKPFTQMEEMDRVIKNVQEKLKSMPYHAIIDIEDILRSEEHTSELQSRFDLVCRLLHEKKNNNKRDRV